MSVFIAAQQSIGAQQLIVVDCILVAPHGLLSVALTPLGEQQSRKRVQLYFSSLLLLAQDVGNRSIPRKSNRAVSIVQDLSRVHHT